MSPILPFPPSSIQQNSPFAMPPRKNPPKKKQTVVELPGGALQTTFAIQGYCNPFHLN
jgi:hypothetical protein